MGKHPQKANLANQGNPNLPPNAAAMRAQISSMTWSAPLPPPDALIQYNQAFPGCAERIVASAESQAQHRQHLEKITVEGNVESQRRGQWMAFILALLILVGGFVLIYLNKSILGTAFIGTDIAATVGVFIYGKYDQRRQLRKKANALER